jgi:lactoylglutathione lyase
MKVGYVVLYVKDEKASLDFWIHKVGLVLKDSQKAGDFVINKIGFADQDFSFELVPLQLMENNPDGLNLGTPSICFQTNHLEETHKRLKEKNVKLTEISNHFGTNSFAFSDEEDHWFAVM